MTNKSSNKVSGTVKHNSCFFLPSDQSHGLQLELQLELPQGQRPFILRLHLTNSPQGGVAVLQQGPAEPPVSW